MNYSFIRPLLFKLEPEKAHSLTMFILRALAQLKATKLFFEKIPPSPCEVMGLRFENRIGCAPGLDKNGYNIDALGQLGFGHLEVGGITPLSQPGNPRPRLFRLVEDEAIINRYGFNNIGVDAVVQNLKRRKYRGIVGINIGKNKDTPLDKAAEDYNYCIERVYPYVDFMTINISSPNTPGLRELQNANYLADLLKAVKDKQQALADQYQKYVPLAVKLSPDLSEDELRTMASTIASQKIDAVIATNSTLSRPALISPYQNESGGLSGKPLTELSTKIIQQLYQCLPKTIPIIAVGGIMCPEDAIAKLKAGAQLVQIMTGLIYQGPRLIVDIAKNIKA
jgi:dihydroorotate dehydrogenase